MKLKNLFLFAAMAVLPFVAFAAHEDIPKITLQKIHGLYTVTTFSNSNDLDALISPIQSEAELLKLKIRIDGTVDVPYLLIQNVTTALTAPVPLELVNVTGTIVLDPTVNGLATLTLNNVPSIGLDATFKVLFKTRKNKVRGFVILSTDLDNSGLPLWKLGQGFKNT